MDDKAIERFLAKIAPQPGGCWLWAGTRIGQGYGRFRFNSRMVYAHRWAYEHWVGPIPDGLELDHLCNNPPCVNPDHLEPVTHRENMLRGSGLAKASQYWANKTHCPAGHPYDEANTYVEPATGGRKCRACWKERNRIRRLAHVA